MALLSIKLTFQEYAQHMANLQLDKYTLAKLDLKAIALLRHFYLAKHAISCKQTVTPNAMELIHVVLFLVVVYLLYRLGTNRHDYWSKRNVPFLKPVPFLGSVSNLVLKKKSDADSVEWMYNSLKNHRFGGIWFFTQPALMIRDPELIKMVTIKDFDHFMNRNMVVDEDLDPIFAKNLMVIRDQKWKNMRNILTPTFTSAKMKNMFHLVNQCGENMTKKIQNSIKKQIEDGHPDGNVLHLEVKNFATLFTNDVISTCAFGVEVNSFENPKNEFYVTGQQMTDFSGKRFFVSLFRFLSPYLSKKLKLQLFTESAVQFFRDLVMGSIKMREEKKIVRQDMIHLLMQAKNNLKADGQGGEVLEGDDLTAQVVLFLLAGFDTTSTFLSFTAYELAVNQDVQTKLQKEIDRVVEEDGGVVTYEGICNKMSYLNMVVNESLRKWPPINMVDRTVSYRYVIPASGNEPEVVLEKSDVITLPIQGLHHDPKYFPEPKKFDPERFSEENKDKITPFSFIPFGTGPRNCIGMRFALMEGKVCLVHLLKSFSLEVVPETQIPLQLKKGSFTKTGEKGIWVGLKPRFSDK